MADDADELKMRYAATLLRIQQAREARHRHAVAQSERMHEAAVLSVETAVQRRAAHELDKAGRLNEAHDELRGQVVDLAALYKLEFLEKELGRESTALAASIVASQAAWKKQVAHLASAREAWQSAARTTRKRERLAKITKTAFGRKVEAMQDAESEDQVADGRDACSPFR